MINDGQRVRALESNAAWASKQADNTLLGKQTLNRSGSGAQVTDVQQDINDLKTAVTPVPTLQAETVSLRTLTGTNTGDNDLGTFTGSTINDNTSIKNALQLLETADELKIPLTQKGASNGVATLDSGGKIPSSQLPSPVFEFKGLWNASTNTPTLADGIGDAGDVYKVSVAGTQNLGSGPISFSVGDEVYYDGSVYEKLGSSSGVSSVNGQVGVVVLNLDDINDVTITSVTNRDFLQYNGTNWVNKKIYAIATDSTTTGSSQALSAVSTSIVRVTNAGLISINQIPAGFEGQPFVLINRTGVAITLLNDNGGTTANRILTGTSSDLDMDINAAVRLEYDSTTQRWQVVGGSGSGSGSAGSGIRWYLPDTYGPIRALDSIGLERFKFATSPDEQAVFGSLQVPSSYKAGKPIKLINGKFSTTVTSGNVFMQASITLVRNTFDLSSPPTRTSANTQQTVAASANVISKINDIDVTDSSGLIGGTAVSAGDNILIKITRKTSSETSSAAADADLIIDSFEPTFK